MILTGGVSENVLLPGGEGPPSGLGSLIPKLADMLYKDPPSSKPAPLPPLPEFINEPLRRPTASVPPYIPLPKSMASPGTSPAQTAENKAANGGQASPIDSLGAGGAQNWMPWILAALALAGALMLASGSKKQSQAGAAPAAPAPSGGGRRLRRRPK